MVAHPCVDNDIVLRGEVFSLGKVVDAFAAVRYGIYTSSVGGDQLCRAGPVLVVADEAGNRRVAELRRRRRDELVQDRAAEKSRCTGEQDFGRCV